ncbi:aminoacyl-tRNA hydrolase [Burkholderia ubonensis]|uniref:aminoacyl-tRNA hydrolase n=1 Tax=Burkholderia ubonensis TaxID=101571 RepID=UPI000A6C14B7|nr:aminoacyl-tRNA hydrolase [Burkholderia ubonensis]
MNQLNETAYQHSDERTHKQVIVIRKDLKMRQGKAVAQGSHASMRAALCRGRVEGNELRIPLDADVGPWLLGRFTKVCVHVPDETALLDVYNRAKEAGLPCALIQDAGLTEFKGVPTLTAVAVGPSLNEAVDRITGELPLL